MSKNPKVREIAIVIFYDKVGNILVQDRTNKQGAVQKYGFFGGGLEEGESPKQALEREVREELGTILKNFFFWKKSERMVSDSGPYSGMRIIKHIFLAPITPEIESCKAYEGTKIKMKLSKAVKEKGFSRERKDLLDLFHEKILDKSE